MKKFSKNRFFYLMLIPIALYFIVFTYYPLALGVYNSFRDVKMFGSTFVGMENYKTVMIHPQYKQAFVNTLVVNSITFVIQFVWGLLLALALNEIKKKTIKSAIQSISYLPYLLSWSVVGGIWISILSPTGLLNGLLSMFSGKNSQIIFMAEPSMARTIMVFTGAWKQAGYSAVLFLAAVVGFDTSIYEAASIDGASRFQQITKITVPLLVPTMKVVFMFGIMGILRNFDQIFVMGNANIYDKIRNLLFLVYDNGIKRMQIGSSTAAASLILLVTIVISSVIRKIIKYDESYD